MANYKKLTDVEVMEEVSESTMALVEDNGKLKKVPCGAGFGGGSEVATAILKSSRYGKITPKIEVGPTWECINMTFEEACEILASGKPLIALIMDQIYGSDYTAYVITRNQLGYGTPAINFFYSNPSFVYGEDNYYHIADPNNLNLYWTAEELSQYDPNTSIPI